MYIYVYVYIKVTRLTLTDSVWTSISACINTFDTNDSTSPPLPTFSKEYIYYTTFENP